MKISNNPLRLTCPHCGGVKHILTILSGNTCRAKGWSDGRWYYPWLKQPSPYQKCPHCGHFYSYVEANPTIVKMETADSIGSAFDGIGGALFTDTICDFPALPEFDPEVKAREDKWRMEARRNGFGELSFEDLAEAGRDILPRCKTVDQKEEYYLTYIRGYNDARTNRLDEGIVLGLDKERLRFEEYAKELSIVRGKPRTINAEMCRELGHFDDAIEICHQLLDTDTDVEAVRQILAHAEAHDPGVFELQFEEE